jgi:hypothetical protein
VTPFLVTNASDRQAVFLQLETTGGVGLSSDAIDRFVHDALQEKDATRFFFPDWGVFMQFAMLTRGTIPYTTSFSTEAAHAVLCAGQDAEVVTVAGQSDDRLKRWSTAMGWPYETSIFRQRDGTPVLLATLWKAKERPPGACP